MAGWSITLSSKSKFTNECELTFPLGQLWITVEFSVKRNGGSYGYHAQKKTLTLLTAMLFLEADGAIIYSRKSLRDIKHPCNLRF